jgi:tetratricopeptide (TPR) repeat protein
VTGTQLDLFGDRHLQLERARRALTDARTGDAIRELVALRSFYPEDPAIAAELELARMLERRLGEIEAAPPGERPRLLVALAQTAATGVRAALLRQAAAELGRDDPAALLDGVPASALLRQAGDMHAARDAADAAVRSSRRARFLAYLGDVEHQLARRDRARERYRDALVLDPYDVDWRELADDEVASLPEIARAELELDDGIAWSAPVGVVLGVLPLDPPPTLVTPLGEPPPSSPEARARERSTPSPLHHARSFLDALRRDGRERGGIAIAARREMRALAPQLLAAYLEHR